MQLKRKFINQSIGYSYPNKIRCISGKLAFDENTELENINSSLDNESQLVLNNSLTIRNEFLQAQLKYEINNMIVWYDDYHSPTHYENVYRMFLERCHNSILIETKVTKINNDIIISGVLEFYKKTDIKFRSIQLSNITSNCTDYIQNAINSILLNSRN